MKRVEVLVRHVFQSKWREVGEQYDIDDRDEPEVYRTLAEAYKWVRPVDTVYHIEAMTVESESTPELPVKRGRGRPKGSGVGHYNRRDLRAEE